MSSILTIIEFVFFFGLLIFFHELGHFLSSKALGIEERIWIWLPAKDGETVYLEGHRRYPQLDPIWRLCAPQRGGR